MPSCDFCSGSGNLGNSDVYAICEMSREHPCSPCQEYIRLETQILAMKASLALMLTRQKELRTDINRCHDPLTRHLPTEIVSAIFESYAMGYASVDMDEEDEEGWEVSNNDRSPLLLGAVCRSWRQISWSSPRLWTCVGICLKRPDDWNCLETAQKWLDRSLQLPLSIHLSIHQPDPLLAVDPREVFSRLIFLINQQSNRWLSLRVFCSPVLLPLIRGDGHGAPILQSLSISHPNLNDGTDPINFSIAGVKCRPTFFQGINIGFQSLSIDWSQVTAAHFSQSTDIHLDEFVELLRQAPHLVECRIPVVSDPEPSNSFPPDNIRGIRHNLQSLTIGCYDGTTLKPFLNCLFLPQLTHLRLVEVFDAHLEYFVDLIMRSSCRIIFLQLENVFYLQESLLNLLRSTEFLKELKFLDCCGLDSEVIDLNLLLTNASTAVNTPQKQILPDLQFLHRFDVDLPWDALFWAHIADILTGSPVDDGHRVRKRSLQRIYFATMSASSLGVNPLTMPICTDKNIVSRLIELSKSGLDVDLTWNRIDILQASMRHHGLTWTT